MILRVIISILLLFPCYNLFAGEKITFCAVGDVLLDRGIRDKINNYGVKYPFLKTAKFINSFDLAFCNLECPISNKGDAIAKEYTFRADPEFIEGLKYSGFNTYCLANNHSLDYGRKALIDTISILEKNKFHVIGAGKNQKKACKAVILKQKGIKIAFLAYVYMALEGITYRENLPGPSQAEIEEIIKEVRSVRKRSDIVVVSFHWGTEYNPIVSEKQREYAHKVIENGANLVIGHHPHVIQTIEKYEDSFIIYSLGNFVFDQHKKERIESIILACDIHKSGIENVKLVPILIRNYRPDFAKVEEARDIFTRIKKLSKNCKVSFEPKDNTIKLD